MVRLVATAVYFRSVGLQVWRAQYVVNAHTDATLVIGPAGSCAGGNEAVGEAGGNTTMGIRYGRVVEVAADYHAHTVSTVLADVFGHGIGLRSTFPRTSTNLGDEKLRLLTGGIAHDGTVNEAMEAVLVLNAKADTLKVVVDKKDFPAINLQEECHTDISLRLIMYPFMAENGELGIDGKDVVRRSALMNSVAVFIPFCEHGVYGLSIVRVASGFLKADDIGSTVEQVVDDRIHLVFVIIPRSELPDIIRQHLYGTFGRVLGHIYGTIAAHRPPGDKETDERNEDVAPVEHQPEDDKQSI